MQCYSCCFWLINHPRCVINCTLLGGGHSDVTVKALGVDACPYTGDIIFILGSSFFSEGFLSALRIEPGSS